MVPLDSVLLCCCKAKAHVKVIKASEYTVKEAGGFLHWRRYGHLPKPVLAPGNRLSILGSAHQSRRRSLRFQVNSNSKCTYWEEEEEEETAMIIYSKWVRALRTQYGS